MSQNWHARLGDQTLGPFSSQELVSMASDGRLLTTDQVRREDMTSWISADRIKGLRFATALPTPPPAVPTGTLASEPTDRPPPTKTASGSRTMSGKLTTRMAQLAVGAALLLALAAYFKTNVDGKKPDGISATPTEINGLRANEQPVSPSELSVESLRVLLNGTFEDRPKHEFNSWTFSYPSWKANSTAKYFHYGPIGMFEVVYTDKQGHPASNNRDGFALVLMRSDYGNQQLIAPIVPLVDPDGTLTGFEVRGIQVGPMAIQAGEAQRFVMERVQKPTLESRPPDNTPSRFTRRIDADPNRAPQPKPAASSPAGSKPAVPVGNRIPNFMRKID